MNGPLQCYRGRDFSAYITSEPVPGRPTATSCRSATATRWTPCSPTSPRTSRSARRRPPTRPAPSASGSRHGDPRAAGRVRDRRGQVPGRQRTRRRRDVGRARRRRELEQRRPRREPHLGHSRDADPYVISADIELANANANDTVYVTTLTACGCGASARARCTRRARLSWPALAVGNSRCVRISTTRGRRGSGASGSVRSQSALIRHSGAVRNPVTSE